MSPDHDASSEVRKMTEVTIRPGQVRLVKSAMRRVFVKVLGKGFEGAPWNGVLVPRDEEYGFQPRWRLQATGAEFDALKKAVIEEFKALGYKGEPVTLERDGCTSGMVF